MYSPLPFKQPHSSLPISPRTFSKVCIAISGLSFSDFSHSTSFCFESLLCSVAAGSVEANDNLKFLSTLQESCVNLASAVPKDIPLILKDVLSRIRMIWTVSAFYSKVEPLTGLLRKVSNQIIVQVRVSCMFFLSNNCALHVSVVIQSSIFKQTHPPTNSHSICTYRSYSVRRKSISVKFSTATLSAA